MCSHTAVSEKSSGPIGLQSFNITYTDFKCAIARVEYHKMSHNMLMDASFMAVLENLVMIVFHVMSATFSNIWDI